MKRLSLACALSFAVGCAAEDAQLQWNEAMKDARGENMEMRNDFSTPKPAARTPAPRVNADE